VDWAERANLYCSFYDKVPFLLQERTVLISYDRLCADPENTIVMFKADLADLGVEVSELDDGQFTQSHATNSVYQRPTIGFQSDTGIISFRSIPSFDSQQWSKSIAGEVFPIVKNTDDLLRSLFPDVYAEPAGFSSCERVS
jgi:hypothetical protein